MKDLIKINCFITNGLNKYEFYLYIYDDKCNLIKKIKTKNGYAYVKLKEYGLYKICAIPLSSVFKEIKNTNFLFSKSSCKTINLFFSKKNIVTIKLIDRFYNMKVKEGEIKLWIKTM